MRPYRVLFMYKYGSEYWNRRLISAVKSIGGELDIFNSIRIDSLDWHVYDCVILESTSDIIAIIDELRERNNSIRIIVVSADPRWDQAREVMLAGAVDYIRKDSDVRYISNALRKVMKHL